ncbi:MAG TPA: lipid-binding SYLF domain-containing protein [Pyrinomonadaceae bacterium]|jgi:lipid-binding SYLF domain-containing protein|nr:lipid-binding SYLF domain-containing protein [Pyrinomonadaceae bacterium]
MKHRLQQRAVYALGVVALLCLAAVVAPAQDNKKRLKDAARHSSAASKVFKQIMGAPDQGIPRELLDKAEAIVVFPGVKKAAFIIGGSGGQGVVSRRAPGGWSEPAFLNLGGGSIGAQIGASSTDYVLLIMNQEGLKGLLEDKFEMGGEASVAAGPVGRTAAATTNATLDAGILSYSRSKGAFAGVSLKGAVIGHDNDLNQAIYGKNAHELLSGTAMTLNQMPPAVQIFPRTLSMYSKR